MDGRLLIARPLPLGRPTFLALPISLLAVSPSAASIEIQCTSSGFVGTAHQEWRRQIDDDANASHHEWNVGSSQLVNKLTPVASDTSSKCLLIRVVSSGPQSIHQDVVDP